MDVRSQAIYPVRVLSRPLSLFSDGLLAIPGEVPAVLKAQGLADHELVPAGLREGGAGVRKLS